MATEQESSVPSSDNQESLDGASESLQQSARRVSEAANKAYSAGVSDAQAKVRHVSGMVLENANKAADTSKAFFSKMARKVDNYAGKAQQKASDFQANFSKNYVNPSATAEESGTVSRDAGSTTVSAGSTTVSAGSTTESGDGNVGFPLSILTWCSTLCGGSKSGENAQGTRDLPVSYLTSAANRFSTALTQATGKLEEATSAAQEGAKAAAGQVSGYVEQGSSELSKLSGATKDCKSSDADTGATS